jgi:hypothetical protein
MKHELMQDWLAAARADVTRRAPDPTVETQLLARVRERRALRSLAAVQPQRVGRPRWGLRLAVGVPFALAATAAVVIALRLQAEMPAADREVATPFIALVASDALAAERAPVVVASQVARTALADYGLPVDPERADEPIDAEFLVSRSGLVLAVRFKE